MFEGHTTRGERERMLRRRQAESIHERESRQLQNTERELRRGEEANTPESISRQL